MKAVILSSLVFLLSCGDAYESDYYESVTLNLVNKSNVINYSRWRPLPEYQLSSPNFQLTLGDVYPICNGEGVTYRISQNGKKLSKIACDSDNNMTVENEVITEEDKCENWYRSTQLTDDYIVFNSYHHLDECSDGQLYGRRTIIWGFNSDGMPMQYGKLINGALAENRGDRVFRQCIYNNGNLCDWIDYSPYVLCEDGGWIYLSDVVQSTLVIGTPVCIADYNIVADSCGTLAISNMCGEVLIDYGNSEKKYICDESSGNMRLFEDYMIIESMILMCEVGINIASIVVSPSCSESGVQYILPRNAMATDGYMCAVENAPVEFYSSGIRFTLRAESDSDTYIYDAE